MFSKSMKRASLCSSWLLTAKYFLLGGRRDTPEPDPGGPGQAPGERPGPRGTSAYHSSTPGALQAQAGLGGGVAAGLRGVRSGSHSEPLPKLVQAQGSQRTRLSASHSDHSSMASRYTTRGRLSTQGRGSAPSTRSWYHCRNVSELPPPATCMSGCSSSPWCTAPYKKIS